MVWNRRMGEVNMKSRIRTRTYGSVSGRRLGASDSIWGIENKVHWILDVTFGEDKNQLSENGAENFSLLSKIALNLLKQDKTAKLSIANKRFKASMDQAYLESILKAAA